MLKNIGILATCLVFLHLCVDFTVSQEDEINKFIQLLPQDQKQAFLDNISRRIYEKFKADGITIEAKKEMVDEELNAQNDFVNKILNEEKQNLRKNNNKNTLRENKKEENSNRDRFDNEFIDLTLRTSNNAADKSDNSRLPRHSVKKDSAIFKETSDSENNKHTASNEKIQYGLKNVNESSVDDKSNENKTLSDDAKPGNDTKLQTKKELNTEMELTTFKLQPQISVLNTTSNAAYTEIDENHSQGIDDSQEGSTTENSTVLIGKEEILQPSSVGEKPIIKVVQQNLKKIDVKKSHAQESSPVNNKAPIKISILRSDDGIVLDSQNHEAGVLDPVRDDVTKNNYSKEEESKNETILLTTTENNLSSLPTKEDSINLEPSQTRQNDQHENKTSTESVTLLPQTTTEKDLSSLTSKKDTVNLDSSQTRRFDQNESKTSTQSITLYPYNTNDDVILTSVKIDTENHSDDNVANDTSVDEKSESLNVYGGFVTEIPVSTDGVVTKSVLRSGNEPQNKEEVHPNELVKENGVQHYSVFEIDPNETPFVPAEAVEITKSRHTNMENNSDEKKTKLNFNSDETRKYRFNKKKNKRNSTQNMNKLLLDIIPLIFPMKKYSEAYNFDDYDYNIFDERRKHSKLHRNVDETSDRANRFEHPNQMQNKQNSAMFHVHNIDNLLRLYHGNLPLTYFEENHYSARTKPKGFLRKNYRNPEIDMDYFFGRSGWNNDVEEVEQTVLKSNLLNNNVGGINSFKSKFKSVKSQHNYGGIRNQNLKLTIFNDKSKSEEKPETKIVNLTNLYHKAINRAEVADPSREEFYLNNFEGLVSVIGDLIKMENLYLREYNWLSSTVDIQSGLTRLINLVDLSKSKRITKPDQQLLKYVVHIFETARTRYQEYKLHPSRRNLGKNKEKELLHLIRKFNMPSSRQQKLGQKIKKPLEVLERVWKILHASSARTREGSKIEKEKEELADFDDFVTDLQDAVFDLHTAIKRIANITKYNNQNWFRELKGLYLDPRSRRHKLQVLTHLFLARILRLIEESTRTGVEKDFLLYLARRQKEIETTKQDTVVLLKLLDELKDV